MPHSARSLEFVVGRLKSTHLPTTNWRQWRLGFTLVELLVVVAIISILTSVAYVSFNVSQNKGRDAKRKQDLKAVSATLVSYYQDNGVYPGNDGDTFTSTSTNWIPGLTPNYIQKLPTDSKQGNLYLYSVGPESKSFVLWALLDNATDKESYNQTQAACTLTPPSPSYNYCHQSPQ